jgi:tRNA(fMet)-specific endonuclease VapC
VAAVVVDTCVASFVFKGDSRAELYRPHRRGNLLVISFMTLAELYRWPLEADWGEAKRERLEAYLRGYVVYPSNRALCREWAGAADEARRNGMPIHESDAWIAATALINGVPLVTNNPRHYDGIPRLTLITESLPPDV